MVELVNVLLVHNVLEEVVDVDVGATGDDSFQVVKQFLEIHMLTLCQFVEGNLSVDGLDDVEFLLALVGDSAYAQIFGTHNLILVAVTLNESAELLAVTFFLSCTNAGNVLQFLDGDGVGGCHSFEGWILEDDIGRKFEFLGYLLTEILEHVVKFLVGSCASASTFDFLFLHLVFIKFDNDAEWFGTIEEALASSCDLEQTIGLDVLGEVLINEGLTDDCIPDIGCFVVARSKALELVVLITNYFVSANTFQDGYNVVLLELFLKSEDNLRRNSGAKPFGGTSTSRHRPASP